MKRQRFHNVNQSQINPGTSDLSNLTPRTCVSILVDWSCSMEPSAAALTQATRDFHVALDQDWATRDGVEIGFFNFASDIVGQDFAPPSYYLRHGAPRNTCGFTSLGMALDTVLDLNQQRRELLRNAGIGVRRSLMVLLSDGMSTDCTRHACARIQALQAQNEFELLPLAVEDSHQEILERVFQVNARLLKNFDFSKFFRHLALAVSQSSRSQLGHEPQIGELLIQQQRQDERMERFEVRQISAPEVRRLPSVPPRTLPPPSTHNSAEDRT